MNLRDALSQIKRTVIGVFNRPAEFRNLYSGFDIVELAQEYVRKIESDLQENILKFWLDRSLDRDHGGYIISFDTRGELVRPVTKGIVTQARNLWLFSRAFGSPVSSPEQLEAAKIGFDFLSSKLWDSEHGGFFWEVDESGDSPIRAGKHLYGQAFGIYALAEYHRASGDPRALALAMECFHLLESRAHDATHQGYIESFNRDWSPLPVGEKSYMGCDGATKTMNTHLHLMEAFTTLYRATGDAQVRERLAELLAILTTHAIRQEIGACTDKFALDWKPLTGPHHDRVSYGHDLESIWLCMEACDALGVPVAPFTDRFSQMFEYAMSRGYDYRVGGFFHSGPMGRNADRREKVWWVQAEACVSALRMHALTGDERYLGVFKHTYDFIERKMLDRTNGEWHSRINPDGTIQGAKGDLWKAGYHNGRAMMECIASLKSIQTRAAQQE